MRNTILKYAIPTLLALATPKEFASDISNNHKTQRIEQYLLQKEKEEKSKWDNYFATTDSILKIAPRNYKEDITKEKLVRYCSQYVRRAGKDVFNKFYSWRDAEERREFEKVHYQFKSKNYDWEGKLSELDSLVKTGNLERGAILCFYNPRNRKTKPYSHVELFAGLDKEGNFWTIGNRGKYQGPSSLDQLRKEGYDLREILIENKELIAQNY